MINQRAFFATLSVKFLVYFSLGTWTYTLLYSAQLAAYFLLAYIAYGLVSLLVAFNFSHDFSHNTVFKSKGHNNLCFILIYTLVGAHAEAWKQRHIHSHHYAPNVEAYDSDLKISKLIRVIPFSAYRWYHRFQHLYAPFAYMSYSLFWVFIKDVVLLFSEDAYTKKKGRRYHLSFWTQKLVYLTFILLLPLLLSGQPWYLVGVGFLLMHLVQSLFLLFTFFMTHHVEGTAYPQTDSTGTIHCSWLMNQVDSSNDMHPYSEVANFILGGFNNHIAHHLFPHIHHLYYPKINRILYPLLRTHGIIPHQTSYWGGLVSHLRLLKRMSKPEAGYRGQTPLS